MKNFRQFRFGLILIALVIVACLVWTLSHHHDSKQATPSGEAVLARQEREERMTKILDNQRRYPERIRAIRELPLKVENEDLCKLLSYLESPLPERGREEALVSLNEIMEQLRLKGRATPEYGICLARIMLNPDSNEVVRDYAVQHAFDWMIDSERIAAKPGGDSIHTLADRELLVGAIASVLDAADVQDGSAWGTTLNALRNFRKWTVSPEEAESLFEENAEKIRSVAKAEEASYVGNRVAAIQALTELEDRQESLRIVRRLLSDPNAPVYAQLSAIAVLGVIGTDQDQKNLTQIAKQDRRMRYAAEGAIVKLEKRNDAVNGAQ
ncbi:hypothetical protein JIN85_18570 [Luteolibacter pohnpeiensis]|uniref:HEAT repeat domain-containing protein n=1 Tax=Luteolibacter pohnpeiensis TaxID=454153 RepID=A0A934S9R1_9BACT|nr:hypothetical protein [Luteolibacter pohnpeiensis]MBK1884428.1 hypothetical protein [Luteolibacter pohnpeiensis]